MGFPKGKQPRKPDLSWKARFRSWAVDQGPIFRFVLVFGACVALLYTLLAIPFFDRALYVYLEANAWLADAILRGLGQPTHVSEVTIRSPQFAMAIRRGCDAVEPTWLLCAAMISFPAPLVHKLRGMLAAVVLLQVLNLIRIVSLYWIGIHFSSFFETAHVELWPTAFILIAIAFFVYWRETSQRLASHVAT